MAEPTITLPVSLVQDMVNLLRSDPGFQMRTKILQEISQIPVTPGRPAAVVDDPEPGEGLDTPEEA